MGMELRRNPETEVSALLYGSWGMNSNPQTTLPLAVVPSFSSLQNHS